ncbi:MAG: DNA mismatch endonuclease Vsr [Halobacteriovoraceae bacterium]|nr:DNA mismatch endonuclease Vsr [Halobacteriovoraceae bacterium]
MDIVSKKKRSEMMSKIKSKDTKIEVIVRSWLFKNGFRFRKNDKHLPGKPDIVLPKYSTVVFVHGCFWHGHENCKEGRLPKSNTKFWSNKILGNINRDKINEKKLLKSGWHVIKVWECHLEHKFETKMNNIISELYKEQAIATNIGVRRSKR